MLNPVDIFFELQNETHLASLSFSGILDRFCPKSTKNPFLYQAVTITEICSDLSKLYFSLSNT